jgi:hypothetical protein
MSLRGFPAGVDAFDADERSAFGHTVRLLLFILLNRLL